MSPRASILPLALLMLASAPAAPANAQATLLDPTAASVGRARLLAQAVTQYAQDHDSVLPPMTTVAAFDAALTAYVGSPTTFVSPVTGQPFVPNTVLSGLSLAAVIQTTDPENVPLFRDTGAPATVAFLDNHVERGGVEQGDPIQISLGRAAALTTGLAQYAEDDDLLLPPLQTAAAMQQALYPYLRSRRVFTDILTGQPFQPNTALSGLALNAVPGDPATVVTVSDPLPGPDGQRTVAYFDGHVVHGAQVLNGPTDATTVHRLMFAVVQYTQDNSGALPPVASEAAFEAALRPYVGPWGRFFNPETGLPYTLNSALNGHAVTDYGTPAQVVFLQDGQRNTDGSRVTGYLDGHVAQDYAFVPRAIAVQPNNQTTLLWGKGDGSAALSTLTTGGVLAGTQTVPAAGGGALTSLAVAPGGAPSLLYTLSGGTDAVTALSAGATPLNTAADGPYDGWTPEVLAARPAGGLLTLWSRYDGAVALSFLSASGQPQSSVRSGPNAGWTATGLAVGPDGLIHLLWNNVNGSGVLQTLSAAGQVSVSASIGPLPGVTMTVLGAGADNQPRLLLAYRDGHAVVWTLAANNHVKSVVSLPAATGWTAIGVGGGADGATRVLWRHLDGRGRLQIVAAGGRVLASHDFTPPS